MGSGKMRRGEATAAEMSTTTAEATTAETAAVEAAATVKAAATAPSVAGTSGCRGAKSTDKHQRDDANSGLRHDA
jgi:hypothetical protein